MQKRRASSSPEFLDLRIGNSILVKTRQTQRQTNKPTQTNPPKIGPILPNRPTHPATQADGFGAGRPVLPGALPGAGIEVRPGGF